MTELGNSLERMSFMQLLLLFGFVICYVVALGGLFGSAVRVRAGMLAMVQAVGFSLLTDPWVHGALLVVFMVAGLGLFVMFSWLLARLLTPRALPVAPETVSELSPDTHTPSQPQRLGDASGAVPKLGASRARATR